MARGVRLDIVLTKLKNKIRANVNPGTNIANDPTLVLSLARKQDWLATQYDWPFLKERWDILIEPYPLAPANPTPTEPWRYYYFPTLDKDATTVAINFERPLKVEVYWSENWLNVDVGIGSEEFNFRNSDGSPPDQGFPPETLDPIQRWALNDQDQFEVWPVPSTPQILRFTGQRICNPLITFQPQSANPTANQFANPNWTETLDLDDELVTLYTAAELLPDGSKMQQLMLTDAANRMAYIRASYPRRTKICGFGRNAGKQMNRLIPVRKNIAVA